MRCVLVVEDDDDLRELLQYNLIAEGFEVRSTALGGEALQYCEKQPPDLVLLDLMLPDVSGIEVCASLRRTPSTANLPVIFLTACGADADRIRGLEVGADDYLPKPFQMRELILRVHALLKRAGPVTPPGLSLRRAFNREQLRVWEGFATNHMRRSEWREAREIWRAILERFEGDLSPSEKAAVHERLADCDLVLAEPARS